MPRDPKLKLLGLVMLSIYLVGVFYAPLHLLAHPHLAADVPCMSEALPTVEAHHDGDDHHHPHPASDHEGLGISIAPAGGIELAPIRASLILFNGVFETLCASSLLGLSKPDIPGPSPPELIRTWQFSFRAALPARAPSFSS